MRRSDREITDPSELLKIIEKCDVCRLALAEDNMPYMVPLNFGYEYNCDRLVLYFHGARQGKKVDMIAKNSSACFEMDCSHKLIEAEQACEFTMEYESIIGYGNIYQCTDQAEKRKGLQQLMKQYAKGREFSFSDRELEITAVFKLEVSSLTGKRLKKA